MKPNWNRSLKIGMFVVVALAASSLGGHGPVELARADCVRPTDDRVLASPGTARSEQDPVWPILGTATTALAPPHEIP